MATPQDTIRELIEAFAVFQNTPGPLIDKTKRFAFPGLIDAGNGGSISVSGDMEKLIAAAARELKGNDPVLARTYTDKEWAAAVRRAFGPPLADIDLDADADANAATVLAAVRDRLNQQLAANGVCDFALGCTLFGDPRVAGFSIGPVRLEPRPEWLARNVSTGAVTEVTARRIARVWDGKRNAKRKPSYDSIGERDILEAVGHCPYVCTIATSGLATEAGKEKALTAARLALCAIALLWETPSRTLDGFNLLVDRGMRRQKVLSFIPGRIVLSGSHLSGMPHGPALAPGEWEAQFNAHAAEFDVVGEVLSFFLSPTGAVPRPKLMNVLAQAMLWFHEGCRESVTLMAIVKFTATLDGLACGRHSGGIRRLITARLGIAETATIRAGGPTMKQAVDELYSDGRSRTVHGTTDKLGHDWSSTRSLAEQFARLCLITCLDWAAQNPTRDDPALLSK